MKTSGITLIIQSVKNKQIKIIVKFEIKWKVKTSGKPFFKKTSDFLAIFVF